MVWTAWACLSDEPEKPEIKRSSWATNKACQAVPVCCHHIPCDEAFPRHVAGSGLRASAWSVTSYDSKIVKKKTADKQKIPTFLSTCISKLIIFLSFGLFAWRGPSYWKVVVMLSIDFGQVSNQMMTTCHQGKTSELSRETKLNSNKVINVYVYMSLYFVYI
jgi:hypothetical protein